MAGKAKVLADLQPIYQRTRQPVLKSEYVRLIADRMGLPEAVIQRQLQHASRPFGRIKSAPHPAAPLRLNQFHSLEENIVRVMIQHPDLIEAVKESGAIGCFQEAALRSLAEIVTQVPHPPLGDFNPSLVYDLLPAPELRECLTKLMLDPCDLESSDAHLHMGDWLDAVRMRNQKQRRLDLREALRQAEQHGDQAQIRKLLEEIQNLGFPRKRAEDTRDNV